MQKQLQNLRRHYKETDHKYLQRIICSVCGTFSIEKNIKKFKTNIDLLLKNKSILSSDNLFDFKFKDKFIYPTIPVLNNIVLDKDGIIPDSNKVII